MQRYATKPAPDVPKWSALLVEAVNKPRLIMELIAHFTTTRSEIKSSPSCNANCADLNPARSIPFPVGKH
jgi:hypothetical protein